jgi:short-subunit dehydrogenase
MAFYQKNHALVTGASSGIGRAIAEELARRKINLVLIALPGTGLEETAEMIADKHQVHALAYAVDLTEREASTKILQWCKDQRVSVRILINNAGIGNISNLEDAHVETLNNILLLNNHALTMITYTFLRSMKNSSPSYIMNVGSLASFLPIPRKAVYAASKSFVYAFSCSLSNELRGTGVSVSCLCPGGTLTSESVRQNTQSLSYSGNLFVQTAEQVAKEAVNGMFRRKRRIIPGLANKFLFLLWTILPYEIASAILIMIFNKENRQEKIARPSARRFFSMASVHR